MTVLLENSRIGVIHLDGRGRILAVNDRARRILRRAGPLSDTNGELCARAPDDQRRLARLVPEALPTAGAVPVSGSDAAGPRSGVPPLVVHVKPVGVPQPDYGARHVVALVLIVEPGRPRRLDPAVVAQTLGLTPAESQVAVSSNEVRSHASLKGHTPVDSYTALCIRLRPAGGCALRPTGGTRPSGIAPADGLGTCPCSAASGRRRAGAASACYAR